MARPAGDQEDSAPRSADVASAADRGAPPLPEECPGPDSHQQDKGRAARMADQLQERRERHRLRSRPYRVGMTIAGFLIVLAGIVLAGPGVPSPGFLVILVGLAVLALEFDWAEGLLMRGLDYADRAGERAARMSARRKIVVGVLGASAVAATIAAVFVFDIPVPILND